MTTRKQNGEMLCIGHRGARGHAPENTLLSVQTALEMGVDWIEIDVHLVEDELLVMHDPTLDRTTNGTGNIMDYDVSYLRSLDAGQGEKTPFLQEIFDLVDRRVGINIELKGAGTAVPVVNFIHKQLLKGWTYSDILVSSFEHEMLRTIRQLDANIKIGALIFQEPDDLAHFAADMGAYAVNPWVKTMSERFVHDAHERGLKVFVYTVNEPVDIERMRNWGVDAVFTDYPDRV